MQIINSHDVVEEAWVSPQGKFGGYSRGLSLALGREESSTDLLRRHPFDVEITRLAPGQVGCPFHSHSAQWEFYHVISGRGQVRSAEGCHDIGPGDAFIFKPGEPHQLLNNGEADLVFYCIADNPLGESCHYPDSEKWLVRSPERRVIRSDAIDYYDREE
jgi:uncharacterized cupin superfamily protein